MRRDLVSRIFWCSDRGLLLCRFGIGAQLGVGERGMFYYTVVHTSPGLIASRINSGFQGQISDFLHTLSIFFFEKAFSKAG